MPELGFVSPDFIVDKSDDAIVAVSSSGQVLYRNRKAELAFALFDARSSLFAALPEPQRCLLRQNIDISFYQQMDLDFYLPYNRRFYLVSSYAGAAAVWLVFRDITEIRRLSRRLNMNRLQERLTEEFADIGYWQLDVSARRFYWSDGMYRLLCLPANISSYRGNILRRYIHPADISLYKQKIKELLSGRRKVEGVIRLMGDKQTCRHCVFKAIRTLVNGRDTIAGIIQNIEPQHCSGGAMVAAAGLAHDIKHHLQAVNLLVEHLPASLSDGAVSPVAELSPQEAILSHTRQIISQIDDWAYFVELEQGCTPLKKEIIDLPKFLHAVCAEYQILAAAAGRKIICRPALAHIQGDPRVLGRILRNLLNNALHYAKTRIILGNDSEHIWIIDDGCGITPDIQDRIFSAFARSSASSGLGLGLAVVKKLCDLSGFALRLKSHRSRYTIFKLRFAPHLISSQKNLQ
ncbi:MAG: PAS domain-containing sensor histidine kinase [Alphaproteobacteria bacterium]|nr:PAS domain-containing sensor histidine kinase [Alphaproteobacteria bacterium]